MPISSPCAAAFPAADQPRLSTRPTVLPRVLHHPVSDRSRGPPPLVPGAPGSKPVVNYEFLRCPISPGFGDYPKSGQFPRSPSRASPAPTLRFPHFPPLAEAEWRPSPTSSAASRPPDPPRPHLNLAPFPPTPTILHPPPLPTAPPRPTSSSTSSLTRSRPSPPPSLPPETPPEGPPPPPPPPPPPHPLPPPLLPPNSRPPAPPPPRPTKIRKYSHTPHSPVAPPAPRLRPPSPPPPPPPDSLPASFLGPPPPPPPPPPAALPPPPFAALARTYTPAPTTAASPLTLRASPRTHPSAFSNGHPTTCPRRPPSPDAPPPPPPPPSAPLASPRDPPPPPLPNIIPDFIHHSRRGAPPRPPPPPNPTPPLACVLTRPPLPTTTRDTQHRPLPHRDQFHYITCSVLAAQNHSPSPNTPAYAPTRRLCPRLLAVPPSDSLPSLFPQSMAAGPRSNQE